MSDSTTAIDERLHGLDAIIRGFSDTAPNLPPTKHNNSHDFWKKSSLSHDDHDDNRHDISLAEEPKVAPPSMAMIAQQYAPLHLQEQFEELYRVLHPALVDRRDKKNASAFLQGTRGSGKSLVLECCLKALSDEITALQQTVVAASAAAGSKAKATAVKRPFRIVRLNGVLVPGSHVTLCVQEILRQLTELAYRENQTVSSSSSSSALVDAAPMSTGHTTSTEKDDPQTPPPPQKKQRKSRGGDIKKLLRLRKTSFTNQIQLLNEILQFACLDGIPILFVLDELDAFIRTTGNESFSTTGGGDSMDRQLLLYHLLDRVATDSSLVSFVGLTCHNGTMSLLEKRIRSRAEGTTRFIYFGPSASWQDWSDIVENKIQQGKNNELLLEEWKTIVSSQSNEKEDPEKQQILDCLQRSVDLGYSVRWFFRVISSSLMLYRHDLAHSFKENGDKCKRPSLHSCLLQGLASMGAPFLTVSGERDLIVVDKMAVNDRIQALRDLSGPQLCLVMAARRILVRDSHRENAVPLTLDRMLEEYKSYKGNSNRYSRPILWAAFRDLLASGLIRPGTDSSEMAPLQYNADPSFLDLTAPTAGKIALHLNLDIHRELQKAMDQKLLDCSAALQEWGKKTT